MSLQSKILSFTLKLINGRRIAAKSLSNPPRKKNALNPAKFESTLSVRLSQVGGFDIITVAPPRPTDNHVIFLHGGAYHLEGMPAHRKIIETMCLKYDMRVTYLDYPLAPEYGVNDTVKFCLDAHQHITTAYPEDNFLLFGDSSGGGLALALLQMLKTARKKLPLKTALACPWVDLSLDNKEIKAYEHKDPILSTAALRKAAETYACGKDMKSPVLSPIYGSMDGLGEMLLVFSTHEIFFPDCMILKDKLERSSGTIVKTEIRDAMLHDWITLPIPEANHTMDTIAKWYMAEKSVNSL